MQNSLAVPMSLLGATDMSFGERLSYVGTLTLLGMCVVFSVLSIVWLAIVLMKKILAYGEGKSKKEKASEAIQIPDPTPIVPVQPAPTEDGALLAAITAAIAVVWESEYPGTGFRVVSYRHVDSRKPWNSK